MELEDAIDYSRFFSFAPPDLLKIFPPAKVTDAIIASTSAVIYQLLGGQTIGLLG